MIKKDMTEIRFYHLQNMSLDRALPGILTQAHKRNMRAVVKFSKPETLEHMDGHLWSFHPDSFLPHGSDSDPDQQPIWLTLKDENPNAATLLILTEDCDSEQKDHFDLCCHIFDGMNQASLNSARRKWKDLKDGGYALKYFQQNDRGGWDEKASTEAKTDA